MRKLGKVLSALLIGLILMWVTGLGGVIVGKLEFYARIARLYAQTPDSTLAMPLIAVSRKQIANTWHAPRGSERVHEGQDIFAPQGTPILSATRGYVYKIGENNLGGKTVSIIGAGGRIYYYAHLDSYSPSLAEGDLVTTKTVLGFVGTTGNAQGTPPHLHFGVYTSSGAINPLPLLSDRITTASKPSTENNQRRRPLVSRRV